MQTGSSLSGVPSPCSPANSLPPPPLLLPFQDGLSSGIETVGGQAVGAEAYTTLGIVTLRVQLILLSVCLPVGACWLLSRPLLQAAGQVRLAERRGGVSERASE